MKLKPGALFTENYQVIRSYWLGLGLGFRYRKLESAFSGFRYLVSPL